MKYLFIPVFLILFEAAWAQDPQFTQFYNNPIYMNPACAGATKTGRLIYNYRTQWPKMTNLRTTLVSADYFLPVADKNTAFGVAVLYMNDEAGQNLSFIKNNVNIAVAIEKPVWRNWRIRGGVQYGFFNKRIGDDAGDLLFEDALINGGTTSEDLSGILGERINYSDISVGTLLSGHKLWFGLAAHHLNRPNQSISNISYGDEIERLPIRWTVNAGWEILKEVTISGRSSNAVRIEGLYLKQGENEQLTVGVNYTVGWLLSENKSYGGDSRYDAQEKSSTSDISLSMGIWLRAIPLFSELEHTTVSTDAIAFQLGVETEAVRSITIGVAYSYDYNISSLNVTGAHEISLILRTKQFFKSLDKCGKPMKWSRRRKFPVNRSYL